MEGLGDIGKTLRKLRGNLSQTEFAKKIGVSLPALQRYEYGERVPPPHVLLKIARFCGTNVDWILTGDLSVENYLMLAKTEESFSFVKSFKKIKRQFDLMNANLRDRLSSGDLEKAAQISDDQKKLLDFMRKVAEEWMEESKKVRYIERISKDSPLYSVFRRIEAIYNKGEKAKFDAIKALLDAFESNFKAPKGPIQASKKVEDG